MRKYSDVIAPLSPAIDLEGLDHPVINQQVTGVLDRFKSVPAVLPTQQAVYFMGRLVWDKAVDMVIPACPANTPFYDLPNVHVYHDELSMEKALKTALAALLEDPKAARQRFDWGNVCKSIVNVLQA